MPITGASLKESNASVWSGLSNQYSTSPSPHTPNPSIFRPAPSTHTLQPRSTMASTSAHGLFEIAPFQSMARELADGSRAPPDVPVIAHRVPRANFETFPGALLSVLQVPSISDWHAPFPTGSVAGGWSC